MSAAPDPRDPPPASRAGRERVYLPLVPADLAAALTTGVVPGVRAHAVTPALREWYVDGDLEELELAAMTDAAQAALLLLAVTRPGPRRRVVVAADAALARGRAPSGAGGVPGRDVRRSAVVLAAALAWADVVSVHLDEDEAEADVEAAIAALPAAASGAREALDAVEDAEACDLLWYAPSEVPGLLGELGLA